MKAKRRYDLDWLRVLLFGLLVPYHAAIGFVSYGDSVYGYRNQETAGTWLEMLIFFSHTWRLPALFMISGVGFWFLLKRGKWNFLKNRVVRLIVPLLVAMLTWNALHGYYFQRASGEDVAFYTFYSQWLTQFDWGHARHLWFLINLFVYGIVLLALVSLLDRFKDIGFTRFALLLFATAIALDLGLKPIAFERPLDYRDFWYTPFFFAGYVAMMQDNRFWATLSRLRWPLLLVGIALSLVFMPIYDGLAPADAALLANGGWLSEGWPYQSARTFIHSVAYTANAVVWCGIVFGFAHHLLNRPSNLLAHLNRAVYPVFIFHFPIMMVGLYYLREVKWPWGFEFMLLTLGTLFVSYATFVLMDRWKVTRLLVGLSPDLPKVQV